MKTFFDILHALAVGALGGYLGYINISYTTGAFWIVLAIVFIISISSRIRSAL